MKGENCGFFSKMAFKKLKKSAESGTKIDQYKLAECYYYGKNVEQDYAQAFHWYVEAARSRYVRGDIDNIRNGFRDCLVFDAMYMVMVCYREGKGVTKNLEFSEIILTRMYYSLYDIITGKKKSDMSDYIYPTSDETMQKVKQEYEEIKKKQKAAEPVPCPALAEYNRAWKERRFSQEILTQIECAAEEGDIQCLRSLADIYRNPRDWMKSIVPCDVDKAIAYYEKAANLGDIQTCFDLVDMFSRESSYYKNIPKDYAKARMYLDKLVALGDRRAIYKLASAYWMGKPIVEGRTDYHKVISLLLPLVEKPCPFGEFYWYRDCLTAIASSYCYLDQNDEAIRYYEKALDLPEGDPFTVFDTNICAYIGDIYAKGLHDKSKGREWYRKGVIYDGNISCRAELEAIDR